MLLSTSQSNLYESHFTFMELKRSSNISSDFLTDLHFFRASFNGEAMFLKHQNDLLLEFPATAHLREKTTMGSLFSQQAQLKCSPGSFKLVNSKGRKNDEKNAAL